MSYLLGCPVYWWQFMEFLGYLSKIVYNVNSASNIIFLWLTGERKFWLLFLLSLLSPFVVSCSCFMTYVSSSNDEILLTSLNCQFCFWFNSLMITGEHQIWAAFFFSIIASFSLFYLPTLDYIFFEQLLLLCLQLPKYKEIYPRFCSGHSMKIR